MEVANRPCRDCCHGADLDVGLDSARRFASSLSMVPTLLFVIGSTCSACWASLAAGWIRAAHVFRAVAAIFLSTHLPTVYAEERFLKQNFVCGSTST